MCCFHVTSPVLTFHTFAARVMILRRGSVTVRLTVAGPTRTGAGFGSFFRFDGLFSARRLATSSATRLSVISAIGVFLPIACVSQPIDHHVVALFL